MTNVLPLEDFSLVINIIEYRKQIKSDIYEKCFYIEDCIYSFYDLSLIIYN